MAYSFSLAAPAMAFLQGLAGRHKSSTLLRNLTSMGAAQLVIRLVRLASTVFISRLLTPQDFGLAAIVLTVYEFVALFTRNGISAQVIQAEDEEVEAVAITAYRMTWIICLALMVLQVAAAWPVAWLYGNTGLAGPIAAMSLIYLATPVSAIQASFQSRESRLGRIAMAGAAQTIIDNLLTIVLALWGLGLWAIILPKILVTPVWIYFVRFGHSWRPKSQSPGQPRADWRRILRFSRNVMGVELLSTFQANIDNALVGYFLGVQALGLYFFAFNSGLGISLGLISAAGIAVYPHFCEARGNPNELLKRLASTRRALARIFLPLILLQASLAPFYVPVVFGKRWADAVPVLSIICLSAVARPFANASSQFLKAVGRPDIELRWQIANSLVLVGALLIAAQVSILAVAVAVLAVQTVMLGGFAVLAPHLALRSVAQAVEPKAHHQVDLVCDDPSLGGLAAEWNALWLRTPGALASQSFGYCDIAWQARKGDAEAELVVLTVRDRGKLIAVWPLLRQRLGLVSRLSPLNSGGTEYDAMLIDPSADAAAVVGALHMALKQRVQADVLHVPFVKEGTALDASIHGLGWMSVSETLAAPRVGLRDFASFEAYWRSLSSNLRNGIKRRRRRLEELGATEMKFETESAARRAAIGWALRQKADWMARRRMDNDFIATGHYRAFLLAYERHASPHEGLSVLTLRLNGTIIACKVGTFNQTGFEGFITVYDPAYEAYSPGALLLLMNLEWCAATGRDYDFRIGNEPYKASWATGCVNRISYTQALTLKGAAYLVLKPPLAMAGEKGLRLFRFARLALNHPLEASMRLQTLGAQLFASHWPIKPSLPARAA